MDLKVRMNLPITYNIKDSRNINIILGSEDDVVDNIKTFEWLTKNKPEARVKVVDKMGHKFDINTFIEFIHPIITFWD